MRDDELDRILSADQGIVPSANFARNVMAKVRMEAAAPPAMAFPWKRALPGLVLCVLSLLAMGVAAFLRPAPQRVHEATGPSLWTAILTGLWSSLGGILRAAHVGGLDWILLALVLTYASVKLSLRVAGRKI